MQKALLAGFSLLFFGLQGQNQSPSGLLQFELLLQEELVPYQNLITIDLSELPRGIYLISIKDEAGVRHIEKLHLQ